MNHDTLTQRAYEQLESMIMFEELKPEVRYSEIQLANMLGLGRTPIREALQRLNYEHMVVIKPRQGVRIPVISVETQLKLLEVRRETEKLCVRLAALRATVDQKHRMLALGDAILRHADNKNERAFLRTLKEIHCILLDASGNEYLKQVMMPLQALSRRFWFSILEKTQSKVGPSGCRGASR